CHELGLRVQERVSCGIAGAQTSVLLPLTVFEACFGGPSLPDAPDCALVPDMEGFIAADFDKDTDVDQSDFGVFQRCWSGTGKPADPACAE
ncbi:MAG TPA: hypothetical protein PKY77_25715, partial [Phycisphaerae bacterium]|nr:hypothetical protein [Phycisphaerae bacterium]HRY71428.1 hypothetical protein [Phycisphaerae bacterium]HSA29972.1 hypothetical protein [Phycisphaerae bacterium]